MRPRSFRVMRLMFRSLSLPSRSTLSLDFPPSFGHGGILSIRRHAELPSSPDIVQHPTPAVVCDMQGIDARFVSVVRREQRGGEDEAVISVGAAACGQHIRARCVRALTAHKMAVDVEMHFDALKGRGFVDNPPGDRALVGHVNRPAKIWMKICVGEVDGERDDE